MGHCHCGGAGQTCKLVDFWGTWLSVIFGSQNNRIKYEFPCIEKEPISCQDLTKSIFSNPHINLARLADINVTSSI